MKSINLYNIMSYKTLSLTCTPPPPPYLKAGIGRGIRLVFLLIPLLFSTTTSAQNLEQLFQAALKNNLELKILHNEYLSALEIAPQVSELPDPEIGAGFFPFPVETRLGPQRFRLSATQMLPWKKTLDSKKELAIAKAKPILEQMNARGLNLKYNIQTAYYELYKIEKSQAIIKENLKVLQSLERFALAKVESGKGTAADVLKIQIQIEKNKQEIEILEATKTPPLVDINQILQRDLDTPIDLTDSLPFVVLPFQKDSLILDIERSHPMLRMFELQQEVSKKALIVNKLAEKPTFGVGLDYINVSQRDVPDLSGNGRDIIQLRGTMKIPIFKQKYAAKEREEQLKMLTLDDRKKDLLSQFEMMIEKAYAQHKKAQLQRELFLKQIELTRAAIRVLETAYSTENARFDELLRLEEDLIDYEFKLLNTIIESHLAKAAIERINPI